MRTRLGPDPSITGREGVSLMLGYANALESRGNIVFGGDVEDLGQIGLPRIRVERNRGTRWSDVPIDLEDAH